MSCINKENEYLSLKNKGLTDDKVIYDLIAHKELHPHLYNKKIPCEMYDKVNLEYYCEDDMLMCVDPEEMAETHYNIGREELIGDSWRLGQDYIPDGADCGSIFVRNDSMSMDFEIVVYDKSWHEIAGEGVEEDA